MNTSIVTKAIVGSIIAATGWIVGYFLTIKIGHGLSQISVYAMIVGWWLTAYLSLMFKLPASSIIPLYFSYLLLFLITSIRDQQYFYHDGASLSATEFLVIGLFQSLIITTPVIFDIVLRTIKNRIRNVS